MRLALRSGPPGGLAIDATPHPFAVRLHQQNIFGAAFVALLAIAFLAIRADSFHVPRLSRKHGRVRRPVQKIEIQRVTHDQTHHARFAVARIEALRVCLEFLREVGRYAHSDSFDLSVFHAR